MDDIKKIAEQISLLTRQSSRDSIALLCEKLEKLTPSTDLDKISSIARHIQQAETRACFQNLITIIKSRNLRLDACSLSLAFRSASATSNSNNQKGQLELVWTGPSKSLSTLRQTDQALSDIITEAKSTLLVVSFAVVRVPHVMDVLRAAIGRGVSVKLIIETEKESRGRLKSDGLKEIRDSDIRTAEVYVWPESERPKTTSGLIGVLHAKCAVADSMVAFISSANLTEAALHLNMELGIIVRNSVVPSAIDDHFNSLISDGVIRRVNL